MADEENKPKLGKSYRGQQFVPVKSIEDVQADMDAQVPYDKPGAMSLDVFFAMRGLRDPVVQAGMRAYTLIKRATVEDWDAIFKTY